MQYGTRWRETRRTFRRFFNQYAVSQYTDIQTREVHAFLKRAVGFTRGIDEVSVRQYANVHATPWDRLTRHDSYHRTFAAIIFAIMYGVRIQHKDDKYVKLAEDAVQGLSLSRIAGRFWVEYLPILKYIPPWVPGSSARKLGAKVKPLAQATRNDAYDDTMVAMVSLNALEL